MRWIWSEVFTPYRNLSSTHLFFEVTLFRPGAQLLAEIICTGGLYGTEVKGGTWRFLGNGRCAERRTCHLQPTPSARLVA